MKKQWQKFSAALVVLILWGLPSSPSQAENWDKIRARAHGQTVYWHAWAGSSQYNDFIAWVGEQVAEYGVTLKHVRITDTADAVRTVLLEKQVDASQGSVDLIWINGANFRAMKEAQLLRGPITPLLPNFSLVNPTENPATVQDFGIATEGYEVPWGMARLNFGYDNVRTPSPPSSANALLDYARAHPRRISYPAPPDFTGLAFLKQLLLELNAHNPIFYAPMLQEDFAQHTAVLWSYLDDLHPHLWRGGRDFPTSETALRNLFGNRALDLMMSYNIGAVSSAIARGELPETARTMMFDSGTLGNVNFVAIPFNSPAPEGAMVVANFLLSPKAQARRQNPEIWGDYSVLDLSRLSPQQHALFDALPKSPAIPDNLGTALPEPHPSWGAALREEWLKRYAS